MGPLRLGGRHINLGGVVLVRLSKERECYRLLRGECDLTHYQVRTLAYRNFPSQRWVRAVGKEREVFVKKM